MRHVKLSETQVRTLFHCIDKNGDGSITEKELRAYFRKHFPDMQKGELKEYVDQLDADGNGKITLEELKRVLTKRGL
ncbi:unnamed protein product [Echinostoma caproni]|uniref:EF-hand domain-containing protein n=1 Tax=Echinostoma caproni TaxID=27848 RepID=A0A183A647_9TREM|nr:unnamed protein product [Echinostoma caproni]